MDFHPREVRIGEFHLVQVYEGESFRPGPIDDPYEVRLPLGDQRDLDAHREAEGAGESRRGHEGAVRGARPEARRDMEPDLVEARVREHADLVASVDIVYRWVWNPGPNSR